MDALRSAFILIFALLVLAKSSEVAIRNTLTVSRWFRVNELAIGFLLVAVATTLPEFAVSVFAAAGGQTGVAVGNVFGSNIANIALVLGVGAILSARALRPRRTQLTPLTQVLLVASVLPLVMLLRDFATRWFGVALLLVFTAFAYVTLRREITLEKAPEHVTTTRGIFATLLVCIALGFVIASAHVAVSEAVRLSDWLGLTQTFIGATIIAVGTSLPEMAVGLTSIRRGRIALAFGNILGACIINLTLVLGVGVIINPFIVADVAAFLSLIIFAVIIKIVLNYFLTTGLTYKEGFILVAIYIIFLIAVAQAEVVAQAGTTPPATTIST